MSRQGSKRSSDGPGPSGLQMKHLAIAAVIIVLGFLIFRKRSSQLAAPAYKANVASTDTGTAILSEENGEKFDKAAYAQDVLSMRKKAFAARALGLKTLSLTKTKGKVAIPFEFIPRKVWCQGGDLDTIKYAVTKQNSKEVLISLESLSGDSVSEGLHVSHENFIKGFSHTFMVKDSSSLKSLSLSICTDRKKSGSCKKAQVMSQAKLNSALGEKSNQLAGEFLFYFQHLLFNGDTVQAYRSDVFDAHYKKSLASYLDKVDVSKDEVQKAWKLNNTIKSNPLDVRGGKIVLSLPYNDPRCAPGN